MTRQWRIAVAHLVRGNQLCLHSARCVFVQHDAFRSPPIPWASWIHPGIAASATTPVYRPVSDGTSMQAGIYKGACGRCAASEGPKEGPGPPFGFSRWRYWNSERTDCGDWLAIDSA